MVTEQEQINETTARELRFIEFRDWDISHKPPFLKKATWAGLNKSGYITRDDTVVYPYYRGIRREPLADLLRGRKPYLIVAAPPDQLPADNIETFFTKNADNQRLFLQGLNAIILRQYEYFATPIRLPRLEPIAPEEHERRWLQLKEIVRPTDQLYTADSESMVSRLITRFDHGPWSHSAGYIGGGRIIEATPPVVREAELEIYHSPRYRIGVYRTPKEITQSDILLWLASLRSQLGAPYDYRGVARLAMMKLFDRVPNFETATPWDLSPNDSLFHYDFRLVHVV